MVVSELDSTRGRALGPTATMLRINPWIDVSQLVSVPMTWIRSLVNVDVVVGVPEGTLDVVSERVEVVNGLSCFPSWLGDDTAISVTIREISKMTIIESKKLITFLLLSNRTLESYRPISIKTWGTSIWGCIRILIEGR